MNDCALIFDRRKKSLAAQWKKCFSKFLFQYGPINWRFVSLYLISERSRSLASLIDIIIMQRPEIHVCNTAKHFMTILWQLKSALRNVYIVVARICHTLQFFVTPMWRGQSFPGSLKFPCTLPFSPGPPSSPFPITVSTAHGWRKWSKKPLISLPSRKFHIPA